MAAEEFWDVTHPYHWQELPQVSFLYPKSMFVMTKALLRQNYLCCNKYLSRQILLRQTCVCQNFCHDKHIFVVLS